MSPAPISCCFHFHFPFPYPLPVSHICSCIPFLYHVCVPVSCICSYIPCPCHISCSCIWSVSHFCITFLYPIPVLYPISTPCSVSGFHILFPILFLYPIPMSCSCIPFNIYVIPISNSQAHIQFLYPVPVYSYYIPVQCVRHRGCRAVSPTQRHRQSVRQTFCRPPEHVPQPRQAHIPTQRSRSQTARSLARYSGRHGWRGCRQLPRRPAEPRCTSGPLQ